MTQEVKPITRGALELRKRLQEQARFAAQSGQTVEISQAHNFDCPRVPKRCRTAEGCAQDGSVLGISIMPNIIVRQGRVKMTQELKPVTRGALDLCKLLQDQGSVPKQEVRDWLAEQDPELTASDNKGPFPLA